MSHPNKAKGDRVERKVVSWLSGELGLPATRTLLSAQAGRQVDYDISLDLPVLGVKHVEVKSRKDMRNYKYVHDWLVGRDILMLNIPDHHYPLVVMTADLFEEIVGKLKKVEDDAKHSQFVRTNLVHSSRFGEPASTIPASVGRYDRAGAD